jgi:hypothetical protein
VARRRVPAGDHRGGAGIPAPRPPRTRLITGAGALACLAAAGAFAVAGGGRFALLADGLVALSLVALAAGLALRWQSLVPWSVLAAAGAYLAGRAGHGTVDGWAAVVGVLLLVAAELASWSIDYDARIHVERALVVRRSLTLVALAAAALLVGFLLLAASAISSSPGVLLAVVGTAAAVASVGFVLRLLR